MADIYFLEWSGSNQTTSGEFMPTYEKTNCNVVISIIEDTITLSTHTEE